jgi:superfamily II RNA helicase
MIYDRFQEEAIEAIASGYSVMVSAPTGAGKTAIAEYVIEDCLKSGRGVIYTAPIKALSNQKFRDFQKQFPDMIGIVTGDVSLNKDAPVLIMTTEIFRNKILDQSQDLKRYSWVIFDEIHYLDNPERGTVWEESLIFLPAHINIVGLSATIPNVKELGAWVESIHKRPVKIISEDKRPVPLHFFFQCHNQIFDRIGESRRVRDHRPNRLASLINYLHAKDGLPCIYFVFGRRRAEDLAFELYNHSFLNADEQAEISKLYDDLCQRYDLKQEKSANILSPLIERGIAYHHAGMLPTLKEVIERLFTSRLLKVIFTTETFALGINMPSRSVIFDGLQKFYGRYIRILKTRDFYQMAGRAGRRGIDKEGFVYCRINPHRVRPEEVKDMIYGKPEVVRSQFNASYATILNLYEAYKEDVFRIYPLSLHYFQAKKHQQREALRLMDARLRLLKESGYIRDGALTSKGRFAKNVYGYELLLSELYEKGVCEELDEFGLGVIAAATVFEPRRNQRILGLPKASRGIKAVCDEVFSEIKHKELRCRIYPVGKGPHFHLTQAMWCWLQGTKFSKILQFTDTDEGELVRYFRMAVQVLREISEAPISSELKERIGKTSRLINRDVVDAEKQLREGED